MAQTQAVKSYRAYYNDGQFVPYESVVASKGTQAIVTILDFPIEDESRRQIEAMRRFREEVRTDGEQVPKFERITLREVEI